MSPLQVAPFQETKEGAHKGRPSILFCKAFTPPAAIGIWFVDSPATGHQAPSERVSETPLYAPHGIGIAQRHGPGL